jgi:CRISPR-associated endonuclease/helicase Cas3
VSGPTDIPENHCLAHVRRNDSGQFEVHDLAEHLIGVGRLAADYAREFGCSDWASVAGLWHDLGKYSSAFQRRIKSQSGYDPDAHLEGPVGRVDHSTAGALHAVQRLGLRGRVLAYLIAGHHAGLADWHSADTGSAALSIRLQKSELLDAALSGQPPDDILQQTHPTSKPPGGSPALWLRMLFSCLVDADFRDTELFMDPLKAQDRFGFPALPELARRFDEHMSKNTRADTPVNRIRADVLRQCRDKATLPAGLFSLTVPTGGGKTLSSMAFALRHALTHGKRRIIYVIPYTSIIEQTADVFREIFGDAVVEHHSNLDPEKHETPKSRLACENWDAPIIITTNVQFFESLHAARTSQVRKLHNIVNSVVVLDEAQLLPPELLKPILQVTQDLADHYNVSCVLCTATQPALEERQGFGWRFPGLKNVQELMEDPLELHAKMRRVEVVLPQAFDNARSWEDIAAELQQHSTVLCIVNRRDDCRALHRLMPKGTIHLSALMCGEHRSQTIGAIKAKLANGESARVVSTQLVEAGVDLDFPVVYRAMGGLDSIAQAAGRCNREGRQVRGKVVVFVPPKPAPRGLLRKAEDTARQMFQQGVDDPLAPDAFKEFFTQLYWKVNELDRHRISELLKAGPQLEIQFRTAAERFQMIDSAQQAPVIVHYGDSEKWINTLRKDGPSRWLMRKLQRFTVTIPRQLHGQLKARGDIQEVHRDVFVQAYPALYHHEVGFLGGDSQYADPNDYIC